VISMVTQEGKICLCMEIISKISLMLPEYSLTLCPSFVIIFLLNSQDFL